MLIRSLDLLSLIGRDTPLVRKASTGGGEYCGPCPWCGGRDRFLVQPEKERWRCRQCTERWQDGIAYLMRRDQKTFREVCADLDGFSTALRPTPRMNAVLPQRASPSPAWQGAASFALQRCQSRLWDAVGTKARTWLEGRGLREETMTRWQLGYSCGEEMAGLWVPRGIVLPWVCEGTPWQLKVRRPLTPAQQRLGAAKYVAVSWRKKQAHPAGGHPHLFGTDLLMGHPSLLLTEGEFDAMLAWQELRGRIDVATLGSAHATPDSNTVWQLLRYHRILLSYDLDPSGEHGARRLAALSSRMQPWALPLGPWKDLSDYHLAGHSLPTWLEPCFHVPHIV